jgi:hypothetical protein
MSTVTGYKPRVCAGCDAIRALADSVANITPPHSLHIFSPLIQYITHTAPTRLFACVTRFADGPKRVTNVTSTVSCLIQHGSRVEEVTSRCVVTTGGIDAPIGHRPHTKRLNIK